MATGIDQLKSSEVIFDFSCTPCSRRIKVSEGKKFCVQCGEHFCSNCLSCHENFRATREHSLVNSCDVSNGGYSGMEQLSICKEHQNKEEDMICLEHNIVCCRVCIAIYHRNCKGTDYLPEAAKCFQEKENAVKVKTEIDSDMKEVQELFAQTKIASLHLKSRRKMLLKRLEGFKSTIGGLLESLTSEALAEVNEGYSSKETGVEEAMEVFQASRTCLQDLGKHLENEDKPIETFTKYIEYKRLSELVQKMKDDAEVLGALPKVQLTLKEIIRQMKASFDDDRCTGASSVRSELVVNRDIPNACILHDKTFCLADFHNHRLLKLDENRKTSVIYLANDCIWGICRRSQNSFAITLPNQEEVRLLILAEKMGFESSFHTGFHCRGIAYFNGQFFVSGDGMGNEKPGKVKIFNEQGCEIQRFQDDGRMRIFSQPRSVAVTKEHIFVVDQKNGLICLNLNGHRQWCFKDIEFPWGVCVLPNRKLLISGRESNNVILVSEAGEKLEEIFNKEDGIESPEALCYDAVNHRLLTTMLNDVIATVFDYVEFEP